MKAVGIIPARYGSTRLPGKCLLPLCGKPMIQWVVENASRSEKLESVVVATDDERIVAAVNDIGGTAVMTRRDHQSGTDRVAEAAANSGADIIVNIQGDEPLIDPDLIDRLVVAMGNEENWDMATAAVRIEDDDQLNNPSVVKVVMGDKRRALYFSRSPIPFVRDAEPTGNSGTPLKEGSHWRHVGIYAYRADFLARLVATKPTELEELEKLEQLRALHLGARMVVLETIDPGIGVDTEADVSYVQDVLRRRMNG